MPIFSFVCHCFFSNGSGNHPMASEVKGSPLVHANSEDHPIRVGDQQVPVGSKEPTSLGESVPVMSESPSCHDRSLSVDSPELKLNSQCHMSEIFEYSELEEATNNFDRSRILGKGGYGTVYSGILKDGRNVAIKRMHEFKILRLHNEKFKSKRLRNFMNEVAMLTCSRHENLVQLYGCTSPLGRELLLVQEYIPNGTIARHLLGKDTLPWSTRLNIAVQTASALAYLHASNIIHRDVKTSNILLDSGLNAKVADFGLSRLIPHGVTHITTDPAGTQGYIDPEYYEQCHLSDKSDVYSFGVILVELISSLPAFSEGHKQPYLSDFATEKIMHGHLEKLVDPALGFGSDEWISETISAVAELAFRCLQRQRDMRPSMDEVLNTLDSIRGGTSQSALTCCPSSCYDTTKVHIVSRLPDDYFEKT